MKIGSEGCNTLEKGITPDLQEERAEKISADTYTAAKLNGRGASAGRTVGWAAVVNNDEDLQRVREDAVIVAPTASRELIVVMQKARAVVTEFGGIGATAFWYAREYDIPAVTGVEGFTEVVREGDLLLVDGTNGTVEIIRHKAQHSHR